MSKFVTLDFEVLDSTSTYLRDHFSEIDNFTFVSASFQNKGKGREERSWISKEKQNLLFSFVIKEKKLIDEYAHISMGVAYIVSLFLKEQFNITSKIKWPNDVFTSQGKICGILLTSHMNNRENDGLIVGVGLNVNQQEFHFESHYPISSIKMFTSHEENITDIKTKLFEMIYSYFHSDEFDKRKHIHYFNQNNYLNDPSILTFLNNQSRPIKILGINDDCSLRIKDGDIFKNIYSGEINFTLK